MTAFGSISVVVFATIFVFFNHLKRFGIPEWPCPLPLLSYLGNFTISENDQQEEQDCDQISGKPKWNNTISLPRDHRFRQI